MSVELAFPVNTNALQSQDPNSVFLSTDRASIPAHDASRADTLKILDANPDKHGDNPNSSGDNDTIGRVQSNEPSVVPGNCSGEGSDQGKDGASGDFSNLARGTSSPVQSVSIPVDTDHSVEANKLQPDAEREEGELDDDSTEGPRSHGGDEDEEGLASPVVGFSSALPSTTSSTSAIPPTMMQPQSSSHPVDTHDFKQGSRQPLSPHNGLRDSLIQPFIMNLEKRGNRSSYPQDTTRANMAKLFTDERCQEFNVLTRLVCQQLEDRNLETPNYPEKDRSGDLLRGKRVHDGPLSPSVPSKRPRLDHGDLDSPMRNSPDLSRDRPQIAVDDTSSRADKGGVKTTKPPPTAPRAMRFDPKVAAVEEFLKLVEKPFRAARSQADSRAQPTRLGEEPVDTAGTDSNRESAVTSRRVLPQSPDKNYKGDGPGQHAVRVARTTSRTSNKGHEGYDDNEATNTPTIPSRSGRSLSPHDHTVQHPSYTYSRTPAGMVGTPTKHVSAAADAERAHTSTPGVMAEQTKPSDMGIVVFTRDRDGVREVHPADQPPLPPPELGPPIPALWRVKFGHPSTDVASIRFEVDPKTAAAIQRWSVRETHFDPMDRHVAVHLLCIPARQLSDIFERAQNGTLPTPAAIADAVWQVKTEWPARGTAVLVMNENAPNGRTWLPEELVDHMPLDISGAVQPNINVLQIVQLADLSEYVFAIHVAEPSARQLRGTDMASEHVLGLSDLLENTRAQVGAFSFSA